MPEGFVRFKMTDGTIHEFSFSPLTAPAVGEDVASVGTQVQAPDSRLRRYNGAGGVRAATAQEIIDYDSARLDEEAARDVDGQKILKAVVLWLADELAITPAVARGRIITKYKSL